MWDRGVVFEAQKVCTLLPSPEPSLLAPSLEAKYAGVSEKVLKGIVLRDGVSQVPIIPKAGKQERPHEIPEKRKKKQKIID